MKFYAQAESAAKRILEAFQTGNLPKALAPIFVHRKDSVPCRSWSWSNQLLAALFGQGDARGYRQWQEAGRFVKKGEKAFHILVPMLGTVKEIDRETGQEVERKRLYGFKSTPVFGIQQTEGEPVLPADPDVKAWLESLPLLEVAKSWGLFVDAFNGQGAKYLGYYHHGLAIAVGVKNLSTWAHELVHAADDRAGTITKAPGQQPDNEVVAELGGAILLEILGHEADADRGGCWTYIQAYAELAKIEPLSVCVRVLNRTCDCVALILDEAERLRQEASEGLETAVA